MNYKVILITILSVFLGFVPKVVAQTEATLSFMDNLYQSTYYSPFNRSEYKVSVGLPAVSSTQFGVNHSGFAVADFFPNGLDVAIDPNDVFSNMKDVEYIQTTSNVDLFHLFMQRGDHGFSFNLTEKVTAKASYASDIFGLAWDGNGDFIGQEIDLSGTGVDAQHYREYAFGYYRKFDKWQFSGKAKFLFGKYSVQTANSDLTISIDDDIYQHVGNADYLVNVGGFDSDKFSDFDDEETIKEYLLNTDNKGFALDLGASYEFSDQLQFNAALTDVGFIKWKESVTNMSVSEESYFSGIDLVDYITDVGRDDTTDINIQDYFSAEYPDSLAVDSTEESYRTTTAWNLALGARYNFFKGTYVVGRMNFNHFKRLRGQFTAGIYHDLYRWFNIGITNTIGYGKLINPGLGIVLKGGPVQFYIVSDDLRAIRFLRAKNVGVRFGLNLVFGNMKGQEKITSVID